MRKKIFAIISLISIGASQTFAQYDDEYEISVINAKGQNEIIELPESMNEELDSLLDLYYTKMYIKKDPSCVPSNVNTEYDKEVYIERLKKLPTIMELPYNDVVRKMIDRYCIRLRKQVGVMLGMSNFYTPIFEEALESYNLPLELKYLPIIESALNPRAVSRVGATGLWQFMLITGKKYGLQVNSLIDERKDPIRSSYAAAQYLRDLYKVFKDWTLVIAAYNCGPENVNKAIRRSGGSRDYWQIYPYLPSETRGYVPAFIAANYTMNYYCEHGICPMITDLSLKTDTVVVSKDIHFKQIADVCEVNIELIRDLNPQFRKDIVKGSSEPYAIRLPIDIINKFIENEDTIYNYNVEELLTNREEVEVNETAQSYSSNSNKRTYSRKQYAKSYNKKSVKNSKRRSSRKAKNRKSASKSITIKSGDTLSEIARKHKTTVKKLKQLNGIKGSTIRSDKKIRVR